MQYRSIVIKVDESRSYHSVNEALRDMGFQLRGKIVIVSAGQKKTPALYEKSGKLYYYLSMFHQNNTIKSIKLGIVESLSQNSGAPLVSKNV